QTHQVATAGYGTYNGGNKNMYNATYVTTSWIPDGSLAMAYTPTSTSLTVAMSKFANPVMAYWYDPTNNTSSSVATSSFTNSGSQAFATRGANNAGSRDWFLVLASLPAAPTNLGGTAGDSQVALSWTAPTSTGALSLVNYLVEDKLDSGST